MIRLGSLAGYPFEGPRLLAGWTPPARRRCTSCCAGSTPSSRPDRYAVIYVGHADDLTTLGFPFRHPQADCWVRRAGDRWKVHIATYEVPGGHRSHREQIAHELTAVYKPGCNERQVDRSWKPEWIGEYSAPTAGPLTTGTDPDGQPRARRSGGSGGLRSRSPRPHPTAYAGCPRPAWPAAGRPAARGRWAGTSRRRRSPRPSRTAAAARPATTPPVRLMCATPGTIGSALRDDPAHQVAALLEVVGDRAELAADDPQVDRQAGDQQHDVDDGQHDERGHHDPHLPEHPAEEQVVLEPLGEHRLHALGGDGDQGGVLGVGRRGLERAADLEHPLVDGADLEHEDGQQRRPRPAPRRSRR